MSGRHRVVRVGMLVAALTAARCTRGGGRDRKGGAGGPRTALRQRGLYAALCSDGCLWTQYMMSTTSPASARVSMVG
jgi:hypothetical protein